MLYEAVIVAFIDRKDVLEHDCSVILLSDVVAANVNPFMQRNEITGVQLIRSGRLVVITTDKLVVSNSTGVLKFAMAIVGDVVNETPTQFLY